MFRLTGGVAFGPVLAGGRDQGFAFYGRAGLSIGHDMVRIGDGASRLSLSVEYTGSVSANFGELIQRHGATLTIRTGYFFLAAGGGVSVLHGFGRYRTPSSTFLGGHATVFAGAQFGNFIVGVPVDVDVFGPVTVFTFGINLGVATD